MSSYGSGYDPSVNAASGGGGGVFPGSGGNVSAASISTLDGSDLSESEVAALNGIRSRVGRVPVLVHRGTDNGRATPGVQADRMVNGKIVSVPGYTSGLDSDIFQDYDQVVQILQSMDPGAVAQIQQALLDAHYYSKAYYGKNGFSVVPGEIDPGTALAWKHAVTSAALSHRTVQEVLKDGQDAAKKAGLIAPKIGPRISLTNPEDLRAAAQSAAQDVLGRQADPGFLDNYVARYHTMEADAAQPQADGTYVNQPGDPVAFAQHLLRELYPVDAGVHDYLNVGNELINDMANTPGQSNLPTTGKILG